MKSIILASGSPRRKELMGLLPWSFEVYTEEVEEQIDENESPAFNVQALAKQKAQAVANQYPNTWVIGADTVVCYDGEIMGKPKDEEDAKATLRKLSGKRHEVYTGVAIMNASQGYCETFYQLTYVNMQNLSEEEINDYVRSKEPLDKAGAYGIQGYGARYIIGIEGDYYNVMGLPVHALYSKLYPLLNKQ